MTRQAVTQIDTVEIDYSDPVADDFEALSRDSIPIRSMAAGDQTALVRIDTTITGRDRSPYYERKVAEALEESGIRLSLVAELDDHVVGFIMANVDYGEFGVAERTAVIHTLGVDPGYGHRHVGTALLSQLLANLATLRVDRVVTEIDWNGREAAALMAFLKDSDFVPSTRLSLSRRVD